MPCDGLQTKGKIRISVASLAFSSVPVHARRMRIEDVDVQRAFCRRDDDVIGMCVTPQATTWHPAVIVDTGWCETRSRGWIRKTLCFIPPNRHSARAWCIRCGRLAHSRVRQG